MIHKKIAASIMALIMGVTFLGLFYVYFGVEECEARTAIRRSYLSRRGRVINTIINSKSNLTPNEINQLISVLQCFKHSMPVYIFRKSLELGSKLSKFLGCSSLKEEKDVYEDLLYGDPKERNEDINYLIEQLQNE